MRTRSIHETTSGRGSHILRRRGSLRVIADPYGLFWFELPIFRRGSAARVSRLIAKDAAQQIVKRGVEER